VKVRWEPQLLGGIHSLDAPASPQRLKLIPFYARANRKLPGRWIVHLPLPQSVGRRLQRTAATPKVK
jgi:hypothetical protein